MYLNRDKWRGMVSSGFRDQIENRLSDIVHGMVCRMIFRIVANYIEEASIPKKLSETSNMGTKFDIR